MSDQDSAVEPLNALDSHQVEQYLLEHPEFWANHPDLIEKLRFRREDDSTVSIHDFKALQLRRRQQELQDQIHELLHTANANERIYRIYADLMPNLLDCDNYHELHLKVMETFADKLHADAVALHVNPSHFVVPLRYRHNLTSSQLKTMFEHRLAHESSYFGRVNSEESEQLFQLTTVGSVAIVRIGAGSKPLGVLAVGNKNEQHYQPGMDGLFINQLCRVIAWMLPRLLETREQPNLVLHRD